MKEKLIRMLELVEAGEDDLCSRCKKNKKCNQRVYNDEVLWITVYFCSDWEEKE
jgi:hypothetical protein